MSRRNVRMKKVDVPSVGWERMKLPDRFNGRPTPRGAEMWSAPGNEDVCFLLLLLPDGGPRLNLISYTTKRQMTLPRAIADQALDWARHSTTKAKA